MLNNGSGWHGGRDIFKTYMIDLHIHCQTYIIDLHIHCQTYIIDLLCENI